MCGQPAVLDDLSRPQDLKADPGIRTSLPSVSTIHHADCTRATTWIYSTAGRNTRKSSERINNEEEQ